MWKTASPRTAVLSLSLSLFINREERKVIVRCFEKRVEGHWHLTQFFYLLREISKPLKRLLESGSIFLQRCLCISQGMILEWPCYCGNQLSPAYTVFIPKCPSHSLLTWCRLDSCRYVLPQVPSQNMVMHILWLARNTNSSLFFVFFFQMENYGCHLQQLVTAKLFATSRLSMWGVSLNSEVPNWTIPIRKALYSWSAPLGNSPPEIDRNRLEIQFAPRFFSTILSQHHYV